jgi:hypothetical protein
MCFAKGPKYQEHKSINRKHNFKILLSYNVVSRNIYEWGTCTGATRRLRFEIVNIEIMQHVFVIKNI